jgi:hypothetical protein
MICTEDSRCIASCGPRSSSYPTRMFTECTCTSDDGSITNICPYTKNKNVLCTSNGVCSSGASGHLKDIFIPTIYGFGGFVLLMCLIKIPCFMNRRSADRKNTREGTMVIIPVEQTVLSLSCLYCCSYKINHSDLIVNPHLIAHGLTAHEIGEKVRLVNQYLALPTSEFNAPSDGSKSRKYYTTKETICITSCIAAVCFPFIVLILIPVESDAIAIMSIVAFYGAVLVGPCVFACIQSVRLVQEKVRLDKFVKSHFADWKERGIITAVAYSAIRIGGSGGGGRRGRRGRRAAPDTLWRFQMKIQPHESVHVPLPVHDQLRPAENVQKPLNQPAIGMTVVSSNNNPNDSSLRVAQPLSVVVNDPAWTSHEWTSHMDENSGKTYFSNKNTGETTWETPSALKSWAQHVDPESRRLFYVNNSTGHTTWTAPDAHALAPPPPPPPTAPPI